MPTLQLKISPLQNRLGANQALENASYAIVRDETTTDWGYGGQTQAARKQASAAAAH